MTQARTVPTLAEAMDQAVAVARDMWTHAEGGHPYALLWTDDGALSLAALAVGNTREAQIGLCTLVARADAALVVEFFESWVARLDHERDAALLARLERGEIQVRDLPPEQRGDGLVVRGETRDGAVAYRKFDISGALSTPEGRTFTEQDLTDVAAMTGAMTHTVFLFRALMARTGRTEQQARAWVQRMAVGAQGGGTA